MTIFGWDASDFDWDRGARPATVARAYAEGMRFFTHKLTESTHTIHVHAGEMVRAAVKAGFPVYGFYIVPRTPGPSISDQTNYAIREADRQMPEWRQLPGFFWQVDSEHWHNAQGKLYDAVDARHGAEMCRLLELRTGRETIHYAPRWSYQNTVPGTDPLWASSYGADRALPFKEAYARDGGDAHQGWQSYSGRVPIILQYGARTIIGGQHTCDANAFRGTAEQLLSIIKGKPQEEETNMKTVLVSANGDPDKKVYLSNGVYRYWVGDHTNIDKTQGGEQVLKDVKFVSGASMLGSLIDDKVRFVDDLDAFGVEIDPKTTEKMKALDAKLDKILALLTEDDGPAA